jgi:hypothetical protein
MPAPKKSVVGYIAKKIAKKAVAKPKPRSVNNVRISPDKTTGRIKGTKGMEQVVQERMRMNANPTKAAAKANARGLKAANKPTNRVGSKADKALRARTKSVQMSKEETKAQYDFYYGKGSGNDITQINKRVVPKNEARSVRKNPKKKSK